jgi:beta-lactamase regulating signal transducer with metallopeptidase domain
MNWLDNSSPGLLALLGLVVKVTIVLALTWMIAGVLRRRSAAEKHWVWAAGILGALMLPFFISFIPARYSRPLEDSAAHWVGRTTIARNAVLNEMPFAIVNPSSSNVLRVSLAKIVLSVWTLGVLLEGFALLLGFLQLIRISVRATPLQGPTWTRFTVTLSKAFAVARPVRLLQCSSPVAMPLTWGLFRPRIILPSSASEWSEDRQRIVLAHELVHISRHDWFLQICAELLRCFYWFHPLAWVAARKLRQESEHACDNAVLNSGIPASDYAEELLHLARTLECPGRRWSSALAIARPSNLERRFIAMLNSSINRGSLSKRTKLIIVSVAVCLLLPLAAFRVPAQNQPAKTSTAPQGWSLMGSTPADYETGVDPQASYKGFPSAYLKSKPSVGDGFGTLNQAFRPGQYAGRRVRLSAFVKAEGVSDWAGLWMRVDSGSNRGVRFDNMQDRPIKGTTEWKRYEVVLDVPQDATTIAIGVLLNKSGTVWVNSVKFEPVGDDVSTTGKFYNSLSDAPTNLNFKN